MFKKLAFYYILCFYSILFVSKSFACEISYIGFQDNGLSPTVSVSQDCSSQQLINYYKSLDENQKQNFKNYISNLSQNEIPGSFQTIKDVLLKSVNTMSGQNSPFQGVKTTVVVLGKDSSNPINPDEFKNTFGVPFNNQNFGQYSPAANIPDFAVHIGITPIDASEISNAISAGFVVANFLQTGLLQNLPSTLSNIANNWVVGFKAIIFGNQERDPIADANIILQTAKIKQLFANYSQALLDIGAKIDLQSHNLTILSDLALKEMDVSQDDAIAQLQSLLDAAQAQSNTFDATIDHIQTLTKNEEEALHKSEDEINKIRNEALPDNYIQSSKEDIKNKLQEASPQNPFSGLKEISDQEDLIPVAVNALEALQRQNIVSNYVDQNGLVLSLVAGEEKLNGYHFKTSITGPTATTTSQMVRDAINQALAMKQYATSPDDIARGNIALKLALAADESYGEGQRERATRDLMSSLEMESYRVKDTDYDEYKKEKLADVSKSLLQMKDTTADTYEGYKTIEVANTLAYYVQKRPTDSNFQFFASLAMHEMQYSQDHGDLNQFTTDTKNSWNLVDFAKGLGVGLWQFTRDTATGLWTLVNHPINSAEAMVNAVINYRETTRVILEAIEKNIDNFPNMTPEEQGALVSKTSSQLLTILAPLSKIKLAEELEEISAGTTAATNLTISLYKHKIPANYKPLLPNGGLLGEEIRGGGTHTIRDHVEITADEIKTRAITENKSSVSSFDDLNKAEQCVYDTIQQNSSEIQKWLNKPNLKPYSKLIIRSKIPSLESNGIFYELETNTHGITYNTQVVLKVDPTSPNGYKIYTSYPKP